MTHCPDGIEQLRADDFFNRQVFQTTRKCPDAVGVTVAYNEAGTDSDCFLEFRENNGQTCDDNAASRSNVEYCRPTEELELLKQHYTCNSGVDIGGYIAAG